MCFGPGSGQELGPMRPQNGLHSLLGDSYTTQANRSAVFGISFTETVLS